MYNENTISITKCRALCKHLSIYIVFLWFFFSYSAYSATQSELDHVRKTAENYIVNNITPPSGGVLKAEAGYLDSRLQVSQCPTGLTASSSSKSGSASHITVLIECNAENWRIYVPVKLTITIPAVTASLPLTRGQTIGPNDVSLSMVDILSFRQQGFAKVEQIMGAKVKRNISVGSMVSDNDVCIVCRNDTVVIKAEKNGMSLTTQGIALSDGSLGEQIRVKNKKSNRIIDAQVTSIGEVSVVF